MLMTTVPSWLESGACKKVGSKAMYPSDDSGAQKKARDVCAGCPFRHPCLAHAVEAGEQWGTWGGLGESPRRRIASYVKANPGADVVEAAAALGIDWVARPEHHAPTRDQRMVVQRLEASTLRAGLGLGFVLKPSQGGVSVTVKV